MRKWFLPGAMLLALTLFGCDSQKLMNMFVPKEGTDAGRAFMEDIRTGNFGPIQSSMDPAYRAQLNAGVLRQVQALFGGQPVKSVKIIGSNLLKTTDFTRYAITYEYELTKQWLVAEIVLQVMPGRLQIEGVHAQQMFVSIEQLNAFTLSGKTTMSLLILVLAILIPIFVVGTAVVCWRTPIRRYKWLWRVFVLLGITGLALNWTTGQWQFMLVHVDLLGASFNKALYGPVILQIGFPLGAVVFWIVRKHWFREPNASNFAA